MLVAMSRDEDELRGLKAVQALGAIGPKASASITSLLELLEQEPRRSPRIAIKWFTSAWWP